MGGPGVKWVRGVETAPADNQTLIPPVIKPSAGSLKRMDYVLTMFITPLEGAWR